MNPGTAYVVEKNALAAQKSTQSKSSTTAGAVDFAPGEMLRTKQFWLLFFTAFFATPAYSMITGRVVTLGIEHGLSNELAVTTVAVALAAAAIGKFFIPVMSDKIGRRPCAFIFLLVSAGASFGLMVTNGVLFILMYALVSLSYSGWAMLVTPFCSDLFGYKNADTNLGLLNSYSTFINLLIAFTGTLLVGNSIHYVCCGGALLAAVLMFMLNPNALKKKGNA